MDWCYLQSCTSKVLHPITNVLCSGVMQRSVHAAGEELVIHCWFIDAERLRYLCKAWKYGDCVLNRFWSVTPFPDPPSPVPQSNEQDLSLLIAPLICRLCIQLDTPKDILGTSHRPVRVAPLSDWLHFIHCKSTEKRAPYTTNICLLS